jgi:hypothetical protein
MRAHWTGVVITLLTLTQPLITEARVQQQAATQPEQLDPSKGSEDIDRTVSYPMPQVLEAAKQALTTYGCDIKKETADYVECTRDRHIGAFVGSGGEKITVRLSTQGTDTRVVIKTGKSFVGRLGKKNWSTPVFEDMLSTLKGS